MSVPGSSGDVGRNGENMANSRLAPGSSERKGTLLGDLEDETVVLAKVTYGDLGEEDAIEVSFASQVICSFTSTYLFSNSLR